MTDVEIEITEHELDRLKKEVLHEKVEEISEQLGDPGRYFASFRSKDLLNQTDCEEIKAEKISIEKARLLIEKVQGLRGRHNEHPYDVFVAALKRMRVHVQIVRILNTCLAAKRAELLSTKRSEMALREFHHESSGFPSSGAPQSTPSGHTPDDQINSRGPSLRSSTSSTSSPVSSSITSSSSSIATTPPSHLTSPHTDTDGSLFSPPSHINSFGSQHSSAPNQIPTLPVGFDRHGRRISKGQETTQTLYTRTDSQTTPTISEVNQKAEPLPSLPPGYGNDGRKKDDISELISPSHMVHPNYGPVPNKPHVAGDRMGQPQRNRTSPDQYLKEQDALNGYIKNFEIELKRAHERLAESQAEKERLKQQNKVLLADNKTLMASKNNLESQLRVFQDSTHGKGGVGGGAMTPYSQSNSWLQSPGNQGTPNYVSSRKRNTEPFLMVDGTKSLYHGHRQSEPNMLSVPAHLTRPNKLPLKNNMRGGSNSNPSSYSVERSPMHDADRYAHYSRHSPNSDFSPNDQSHLHARVSSSVDDLTSGGEDKSSIRSFESGNSFTGNNFTLAGQSTTETVV